MEIKKYTMLVLTNHLTHTEHNSLYGLVNALRTHPFCKSLDVASVTSEKNARFLHTHTSSLWSIDLLQQSDFSFEKSHHLFTKPTKKVFLDNYDIVFLRVPHPISEKFLTFVEKSIDKKRIINRPTGAIKVGSKDFLLNFQEFCPPIKLCKTTKQIKNFAKQYPIVLKPLKSHGGKGIIKIQDGMAMTCDSTQDLSDFLQEFEKQKTTYLGMQFLKNVGKGDKRINVVNGKIICSTVRIPKKGDWLCNVSRGGIAQPITITTREKKIVEEVSKILIPKGVVIFGLDTLVDNQGKRVLSEINTMSIGGLMPAEKMTGKHILKNTANILWKYIQSNIEPKKRDYIK